MPTVKSIKHPASEVTKAERGKMTAEEIRNISGLSRVAFCEKYKIPVRTMEDWEHDKRKAPEYVLNLLERVVKEDFEA